MAGPDHRCRICGPQPLGRGQSPSVVGGVPPIDHHLRPVRESDQADELVNAEPCTGAVAGVCRVGDDRCGLGDSAIRHESRAASRCRSASLSGVLGERSHKVRERVRDRGRHPELLAAPGASGEGGAAPRPLKLAAVLAVQRGGQSPWPPYTSAESCCRTNTTYRPALRGPWRVHQQQCRCSATSGQRTIVVMGDSKAMMWMPAILAMAKQHGWVVHLVAKSGCSPAQWWNVVAATSDCNAWYRWAIRQTHSLRPDVTVIAGDMSSGFVGKAPAAGSGMASLLRKVKQYSKQVVVVEDPPRMVQQPVDCLLAGNANMSRCASSPTSDQLAVDEAVAAAVRGEEASYLGTRGWFCLTELLSDE